MPIKPFVEHNTTIDEYAPYAECSNRGFGLYNKQGWCLFGIEYGKATQYATGKWLPWTLTIVVCNVAIGVWNDPD